MHLEILVIFETDQNLEEDEFDKIIISSENDFKLTLNLKAYLPQPLVQFEPLINLGFVPVGTKKIENIQFLNDGAQSAKIVVTSENKREDLRIEPDTIVLPAFDQKIPEEKRKQIIHLTFEPNDTMNLHEKFEVKQYTAQNEKPKDLGYIEVIATSVVQQMSIVFEEGGGPQCDVNFGLLYHGQKKECSAFLVNNGPKEMSYKFFFHPNKSRKDFSNNYDDDDFANTPQQAGIEMTQRILSAEPVMGFVKPYSQIPIKFLCNTKIKEKTKGWRVTLCPEYDKNCEKQNKNLREELNKTETFKSLAAVKFEEAFINKLSVKDTEEDFCKPISVYMEVKAIFPDITIDKTSLNFWDCNLKEKKVISITITNKNEELPIDFSFNKIPHFTVEPQRGIIKPSYPHTVSQMTVQVFFHPENIGKFADVLLMKYVNNMYEIPIRIFGVCKGKSKVTQNLIANEALTKKANNFNLNGELNSYGATNNLNNAQIVPDELALDFTEPKHKKIDQKTKIQRLHQQRLEEVLSKIKKNDDLKGDSNSNFNPSNEHIRNFEDNFKIYNEIFNHKAKANAELVRMRIETKKKEMEKKKKKTEHIEVNGDALGGNAVDKLMHLPGNRLESPKLRLPEPKDTLWVVKPIGQYEPVYMEEAAMKEFVKSPDELPESVVTSKSSNKTGDIPRTHKEIRECEMELSGEDLQKIQVYPKELRMGQVFKKSEKSQTFWVKNNHRNCIFVQLEIDGNFPDLQKTFPKSHVINPGEIQGFRVTVCSANERNAIYPVKYTINYKHVFKLRVTAEIIKVKLDITSNLSKFQFRNDKLDKENKVDMSVKQKIKLFNVGNAKAKVKWVEHKEKAFSIEPMELEVIPKEEREVFITFNPFNATIQKEKYTEELLMNIENGDQQSFPVEGIVQSCNVKFFNLPNDTVDFEMVHTGVPTKKTFALKNETSRVVTAYQIQNDYQEILDFKEPCGFLTEKAKTIEVTLTHKDPSPDFNVEVPILIRGANKLILRIHALIVEPEVLIVQDDFDFGGVSFNEPTAKTLTFKNNSKLAASVEVNLNTETILRNFKLVLPEKTKQDRPGIITPLEKEKKDLNPLDDEEDHEEEEQNEEEEEAKTEDLREFVVNIPPGEQIDFDFIFCPESLDIQNYDFDINFKLVGASEEYKGLRRHVKGTKMTSVISISEMDIKFPETFIYENANNSGTKSIYLGGVQNKALTWEFILPEEFENEGVFSVTERKGEIPKKDSSGVQVTFRFTPKTQREYKSQVTLKVIDEDNNVTTKTLKLQGIGLLPRLYFDRRELILPIVPLGFESSIKFKVKNKGYQNEEIRYEFETYPQGVLPIELIWLDNNHTVGYNKNEIRCEVRFKSNKPITFTTKLIFFDKEGQQFPIQVAGTADNCLLTNFSYFQRNDKNSLEFVYDKDNNSINLKKVETIKDNDDDLNMSKASKDDEKKSEKGTASYAGSCTVGSPSVLLGYNRINNALIDQNCKVISRYLRKIQLDDQFIQNNNIGKIFPTDFIKEDNGKFIYVLIKNLIGKEPPGKLSADLDPDPTKRAFQLRDQYCQLLRFLQECGACLNCVFPEYLMSYEDCRRFIANDPNRQKVLAPNWDKGNTFKKQHDYYHREGWVLLVFQILKIFYLARVNIKTYPLLLRHLPQNIIQKHNITKFGPSNVYSTSEYILLRWLEACYEAVNPQCTPREPKTFDTDFMDSSLLTALLLSYFPKEDIKRGRQTSVENKAIPYSILMPIFPKYGIFTHIKKMLGQMGKLNVFARDMVLFLAMLYQNFQYFYPKDNILFSCVLGDSVTKSITLTNPTNKPLEYAVKFEADECFKSLDSPEILKIDPGKEAEYQIRFDSKISNKVDGRVFFINRKMGWANQAAPIVYTFCSNITGRKPIENKIISTNLYNKFAYKLVVKNPFRDKEKDKGKVEFEAHIEQRIKPTVKKKGSKKITETMEMLYKVFTFKSGDERQSVKFSAADGLGEVTINFLPLEMKTYECNVIFISDKLGEFQYSIEGRVEKPVAKKTETVDQTCNVDERKEFILEIKPRNQYLEKAFEEIIPMENAMSGGKPVTKDMLKKKLLPSPEKLAFAVESSKPYFIVAPTLVPGFVPEAISKDKTASNQQMQNTATGQNLGNTSSNQSLTAGNAGGSMNDSSNSLWLKVTFSSKACMVYEGDITLKNLHKENDIRVYKLYVDVKPKVIKATLEFFCPVKEVITQKIPIENKSDKDWTIKGELSGPTNGFFRHEPDKRIPKHSITDYILVFAPTEKVNCNGVLKLVNNFTSETYFYTLIGQVEDPLAEGNIEITNINAKETQKRTINFDNDSEFDLNYTVETDLDEVISGPASFTVPAGKSYAYEMKVRPLLGKIYFGRIIFRDDKKNYKWWTVRVEAKSQIQTQALEMRTKIRKGAVININLENPLSEPVVFGVDFDTDLFLIGEKDIKVDAVSSKAYKLTFAPLKVGIWENVMLHIYNDKIGEYLYKLKLVCEEAEPVISDLIKAELGKYKDYSVYLENPTPEEIEVKYTNSNPKLFQVLLDQKIIVPSGIKREVLVRYTPSTLNTDEECTLIFDSKTIGKWEYHLRGRGIKPQDMPVTYCRTFVGGMTSGQILFKNPFADRTQVTIELNCDQYNDDTFTLFNKKTKYIIEPFRPCPISFTFKPKILTKYSAELIVRVSNSLFWRYPIEGITEVKSKGIDFVFKTKAKQILNKIIELDLSSLPEKEIDYNDFMYVLNFKEEKYKALINKCLSITFVDKKNLRSSSTNQKVLPLEIKFYPLRPFKTDIEFVLRKKSGGQWLYNIILEATEPDPDDVIHIKSALGKEEFVSFKLQNVFTKEAKFMAYFSHDSTSDFTVTPREGILDQSGKDGSQFVIRYCPQEYGKIKIGKLIIETDEVQWIFEVRGTHLDYKPPEIKKTDVTKGTKVMQIRNTMLNPIKKK